VGVGGTSVREPAREVAPQLDQPHVVVSPLLEKEEHVLLVCAQLG
jgi:hypothetical protein